MLTGYNFTERVRKTLAGAREEAARLHHEYVGTEHILLALTREDSGVATVILENLSADPRAIRQRLEQVVTPGKADRSLDESLPYTARAKKVLEFGMSAARDLGHSYVGTEHVLLGLVREEKGIAAQVLAEFGITMNAALDEVVRVLGPPDPTLAQLAAASPTPGVTSRTVVVARITPGWTFRLFWVTLGIVILIESLRPILRVLLSSSDTYSHIALLGSVEAVGAILFLFTKTMRYGAWILLAVFAVAMVTHAIRGEFPTPLLVYAAGALLVLSHIDPTWPLRS